MSDWQCNRCEKGWSIEFIECPDCNDYEAESFNGYYADTRMTLSTYKWIKELEQKLKKAKEALTMLEQHEGLSVKSRNDIKITLLLLDA
jgi:hypothetical protein